MRKAILALVTCLALMYSVLSVASSGTRYVSVFWSEVYPNPDDGGEPNPLEGYEKYAYYDPWLNLKIIQTPTYWGWQRQQWWGVSDLQQFTATDASGYTGIYGQLWEQDGFLDPDDLLSDWGIIADTSWVGEYVYYNWWQHNRPWRGEALGNMQWHD